MGIDPPRGWLQGTEPYATQEQCVDAIEEHIQEIHMSVYEWTRGLGYLEMVRCMTEEEWIRENEALGHEKPLNKHERKLIPKI